MRACGCMRDTAAITCCAHSCLREAVPPWPLEAVPFGELAGGEVAARTAGHHTVMPKSGLPGAPIWRHGVTFHADTHSCRRERCGTSQLFIVLTLKWRPG